MGFVSKIKAWLLPERKWPEGEPIMVEGHRFGTRLPDGTMKWAPGVKFEFAPSDQETLAEAIERGDSPLNKAFERRYGLNPAQGNTR